MKITIQNLLNKLPYIRGLKKEVDTYYNNACFPVGHYYSPITNISEIKERENQIWPSILPESIDGIDLNLDEQQVIIQNLKPFYNDIPFQVEKNNTNRYFYNNIWYTYNDAVLLHLMLRFLKPKKLIEIGSGFSSAVTLDTNNLFLNNSIELTFIEPEPERLNSLLRAEDNTSTTIINKQIQGVDLSLFKKLEAGDILFVDTSHISKSGSDLNFILFNILPILSKGVIIHFHDVFYPFEYPKEWVLGRFNWNEIYFLRSFLMYNNSFKIKLFPSYIEKMHPTLFADFPLMLKSNAQSLWIEKIN